MSMSKSKFLNFYNHPERIRDHMVEFLANTGSVSKTLFGIELGTVCKTPNRGRTKLIVDTYPEVFIVDGDNIRLKNAPLRQSSTPAFDNFFGESKMGELTCGQGMSSQALSMYSEPQMGHTSPMPSQQLSQCSMYSDPLMGELVPTSPHASQQMSGYFGPPSVTSQMPIPLQNISTPILSPTPSYNQLDMKVMYGSPSPSSPFEAMTQSPYAGSAILYPPMFQYDGQMYGDQHANIEGEIELESASQFSSGENQQQLPATEKVVLDILNKNGGSMEIADLVISMGISPADCEEQGKLYSLLSNSSSIGIEGDEIFIVCGGSSGQGEQKLVMEPTMEALPEQEHRQTASYQSQADQQNPAGGSRREKDEKEDKDEEEEETGGEDQTEEESSAHKEASAKTVRVGSISIANINIKTVNLHLHVADSKNSQVSDLLKFKNMLQDMLNSATQSS